MGYLELSKQELEKELAQIAAKNEKSRGVINDGLALAGAL